MKPRLSCRALPEFEPRDWASVERALVEAPCLALAQHWRAEPERDFRGASVRAGWRNETLWIWAEMSDADIWNDATGFNQPLHLRGDVFEIFLRPSGGERYFEFHVAPHNQKLQLCWPDAQSLTKARASVDEETAIEPFLMRSEILQSWTHIERDKWGVLAALGWRDLGVEAPQSGEIWSFSFGRYDATRGKAPVLSSTSPHTLPDFHRQSEWGDLVFTF